MGVLTFESGTVGQYVTDADVAGEQASVTDNVFTYVSDDGGSGGSIAVEKAGATAGQFYAALAATSVCYYSGYIKRSAYTGGDHTVISAYSTTGTETIAEARWRNDGTVQIRDKFTGVGSSTAQLAAATWYRFVWTVDRGNETQTLEVYQPSAGGALILTLTGAVSLSTATTINEARFGVVTGSGTDSYRFDYLASSGTGFPTLSEISTGSLVRIDTRGSQGSVSVVQTGGVEVTLDESPTGVFTYADPGTVPPPTFDVTVGAETTQVVAPKARGTVLTKYPEGWA